MSDFLNPLGGRFHGPSGPVATSSVLGTVPDPPRGFRQLDPGTIIKGVVLGRESDGLTAIATDKGTVRVASNVPLPAGAQVTLEVRPAGDRLQVLILANDAAPRGTPNTAPAATGTTGAPASQTATSLVAPQTAGTQSGATPAAQSGGAPTASAAGTEAPRNDVRPSDTRAGQTPSPATTAPARAEQPSIQFVGSTLRAVVVQASPLPTETPTPQPATIPATPPTQQASPLPPAPQQPQAPQSPPAQTPAPPISTPPAPIPQAQAPQALPPQPLPAQPAPPSVPPPIAPQPPQPTSPTPQGPVPAVPAPQIPGHALPLPPAPVLPPAPAPLPTGTMPAGTVPPGSVPTTLPPTTPVPTVPVTSPATNPPVVTTPAPTLPQGLPLPANIAVPAPSAAATLQAALLAAGAEKKATGVQPVTTVYAPSTIAPALAAQEYAGHDAALSHQPGQQGETSLPAGLSGQIPAGTAFGADAKQRILALFASAGAMPGEKPAMPAATEPETLQGTAPHLPLGAELKLRVLAVQMQTHLPIEFDPIAADPHDAGGGQVIFGRVVSITPAGHAVIHTPLGDIMMQDRSSLTVGASLALAIDTLEEAAPPAAMALPTAQTPQQALFTLAQSWPTLADLIAIFQGAGGAQAKGDTLDPDIARQALAMLPHAGVKLGAGMMNAMAALRSGDIGRLLGPLFAAKGAGAEREEMVRRLRGEFAQLSALSQERPEVDWRALFLPVIDDQGRVTQINLFYRRPKKGEADDRAGGGSGTRFVVEADFSKLGPFQLDGLMRQQRFDLMIRSRTRLTERMRLEIEGIYEEARGLTGFSGSIAFQTVEEFPVIPLDDLKRGTPTVTV